MGFEPLNSEAGAQNVLLVPRGAQAWQVGWACVAAI